MLPPVSLSIPQMDRVLKLHVHGDKDLHVSRDIRERGIWEPYETSLVLELLQPGSVFVDVGANIGYFTVLAATAVGTQGQVFAFEPDAENFKLLRANVALNGFEDRVHTERAGLSDTSGAGVLYLSEDNYGDHQIHNTDSDRRKVPIRLLNGSEHLMERVSKIDLLKVDTQGAEYAVMSGLMPLIVQLSSPARILIELTPLSLRQAGSSGRQLVELLGTLGQPMWIVDHVEHRLCQHSVEELAQWSDNVDEVPGDEGFMNILVGPEP